MAVSLKFFDREKTTYSSNFKVPAAKRRRLCKLLIPWVNQRPGASKLPHPLVCKKRKRLCGYASLPPAEVALYIWPMSRDFRLLRQPTDVLDYEIAQEQASALGRMGRALEQALAKLRQFDASQPDVPAPVREARRTLVREAGQALWMFVVQREACGLRDSRTIMRDYKVPAEVQQCMGLVPVTSLRAAPDKR